MNGAARMVEAFDRLAETYDHEHHEIVVRALFDLLQPSGAEKAADVACGSGEAVPLPVPDGSLDLVLCVPSLHFLGQRALTDWHRALRPGGRVAYTLPMATRFRPSGTLAALVAPDLPFPGSAQEAVSLAENAGFTQARGRVVPVGSRSVVVTVGQTWGPQSGSAPEASCIGPTSKWRPGYLRTSPCGRSAAQLRSCAPRRRPDGGTAGAPHWTPFEPIQRPLTTIDDTHPLPHQMGLRWSTQ